MKTDLEKRILETILKKLKMDFSSAKPTYIN